MTCYDIAFSRGTCRVEITREPVEAPAPPFVARMALVDDGGDSHAMIARDDRPIEIRAATEALALSEATTFLGERFGALSEYAHRATPFGQAPLAAEPLVIPDVAAEGPR